MVRYSAEQHAFVDNFARRKKPHNKWVLKFEK
jgi:hypothetical protein